MKIHTKHLAVCEKGGKFNKTHNAIYNLQEEPIEPTGVELWSWQRCFFFFLCLHLFILLHFRKNHCALQLSVGCQHGDVKISFSAQNVQSNAVFLFRLPPRSECQSACQRRLQWGIPQTNGRSLTAPSIVN